LTPTGAIIICASGFFLLLMALMAGYLPSRRASRIDPEGRSQTNNHTKRDMDES
jgi:hypothetical protein